MALPCNKHHVALCTLPSDARTTWLISRRSTILDQYSESSVVGVGWVVGFESESESESEEALGKPEEDMFKMMLMLLRSTIHPRLLVGSNI